MYELISAGENTWYINCPAKMGVYRFGGGQALLIDSGNDKDAGRKVQRIMEAQGWTLKTIVNTHSNADHVGGNRLLSQRLGCRVLAAGREAAVTRYPIMEPSFLYGGYPCAPLRSKFLMAEPSPAEELAPADLPEGVEILPLPGHYFDMIGLKTPDEVYFLADCLVGESILEKYHVSFIYDVAGYLSTLDMVEKLEGRLFVPAHAEAAEDIRPLARANRAKLLEIMEFIEGRCAEPSGPEDILKALFDRYELSMDFAQYVLVGSTVRSYLSYLSDAGRIAPEFSENRLLWRRA